MIKEAIDRILELKGPETIMVDGRNYWANNSNPVYNPNPEPIQIETLTGMVDYLENNRDELDKNKLFLHVDTFRSVSLCEALTGAFLQRKSFLSACHEDKGYSFGNFQDAETFIIALQSQFVQNEVTAKLLMIVGGLQQSEAVTQMDDGVKQEVTVSTGVAKIAQVEVPNPVILQPYRTFLEIDQPDSRFVFRMRHEGGTRGVSCALFQADGGLWKLEAIKRIRDWLSDRIEDVPVIA